MRWSFKLFRVGETQVRIHITLLLFMAWYGWQGWRGGGMAGALDEVAFLGLLFLSVLLHEFGHIFAARHYRIATPDILLTPIGGVARIARMPEKPKQELVVALAGPAVTLVIIVLLGSWLALSGQMDEVLTPAIIQGPLLQGIMWTNVILLGFNMIPAFPMDGGRVLRAGLSSWLGLRRATEIAARVGQALALGFAYLGFQYNSMLVLIALFVFLGAESELASIRARDAGPPLTADRFMVTGLRSLLPDTTLETAIHHLHTFDQDTSPVIDAESHFLGTVTRDDLLHGVARLGMTATVTQAMQPPVGDLMIEQGLPLEATLQRLIASGRDALPVVDAAGRFVGLITRDHIADTLLFQQMHTGTARRS